MDEENVFDINKLYQNAVEPSSLSTPYSTDGVVGFNTGIGDSKYDANFLAHLHDSDGQFGQALQAHRAGTQPTSHKLGSALGRLTNIIPEAIGSIASALDFEDYVNTDQEVGNWLTDITEKWKQGTNESLPIYRENPGEALDFGDVGWWLENGSALGQSIGGFAIGGGIITKGLSGLSKVAKARKLATQIAGFNRGNMIADGVKTGITAAMLNQSEAILEATQVYDDIYKESLTKFAGDPNAENKARQKAAEAASATIKANRINILLNVSSANLFSKTPSLTRNLLKKETTRRNLKLGAFEGTQESAEEIINYLAGNYGRAVGQDKEYGFQQIMDDLGKPEAAEAALLGFMGGIGQTVITKEGVNRFNKVIDPETGEKISIRDYNNKAYDTQQELIAQYDNYAKNNDVKSFTDAFNNTAESIKLFDAYKKAVEEDDDVKANEIRELTLNNQAYHAFVNGTTEQLINVYEGLRNGEQKEGMGSDYKKRASEAISKIETLEKLYNKSARFINPQEVYINRAHNNDLMNKYDEVNSEISTSLSELERQVNMLTEGTEFDPAKQGFTFDINNIDFNPAKAANVGDIKGIQDFERINYAIKSLPEYQEWKALTEAKDIIKKRLSENNDKYREITSPEYQAEFKKAQENARKRAVDTMDKDVKDAEKSIKEDEEIARKEEVQRKRDEANQASRLKKQEVKDKAKKTNEALNNKAGQFNPGENTVLGDEFGQDAGKVATITETKGDKVTMETEDGNIITTESTTTKTTTPVTDTEGSQEPVTSNEDSIQESLKSDIENNNTKNKSKLTDVKLMSTSAFFASDLKTNKTYKTSDDKVLPGIPQAFLDFERNGVDKKGTKVTFEINTDIDPKLAKAAKFKSAINLLKKAKSGEELSKEDKNTIVDYLPIKLKMNDSSEVYTYMMSKPDSDNKDALQAYNNRSRTLRIALVKALIDGNEISDLSTKIAGQYGGQLNLAPKGTENSVLDLQGIDGDVNNVEVFVVNDLGELVDIEGNASIFSKGLKENWKGAVYTKIKQANGKDFMLALNPGKVSKDQASVIHDIITDAFTNGFDSTHLLSKLSKDVLTKVKKTLKPEIDVINRISGKAINNIKIKELLDFIYWDGSESPKSKVKVNYNIGAITIGNKTYNTGNLNKAKFVEWMSTNKNRNFKFTSKEFDAHDEYNASNKVYLEYALQNKILTTDVDTSGPNFKGFTNLYINNGIEGIIKVVSKSAVKAKPIAKKAPQSKDKYSAAIDGNTNFANVDGVGYYASPTSGRVFKESGKVAKPGEVLKASETMGELITDNDVINKVEQSLLNNPFLKMMLANMKLKRYDKKSEEKTLKSQEKVVSLQENELTQESEAQLEVTKPRRGGKKRSRKDRMNDRLRRENKLNDKCD